MSWIETYSNKNDEYWFGRVQHLISKHTITPEGEAHGDTDEKWIHELVDELVRNLPPGGGYDGNMRMAALLSYILGLWFSSILYMKSHHPDRPLSERQTGYQKLLDWKHGVFNFMIDSSKHPTFAQGHPWSHPFDGDSISGNFI